MKRGCESLLAWGNQKLCYLWKIHHKKAYIVSSIVKGNNVTMLKVRHFFLDILSSVADCIAKSNVASDLVCFLIGLDIGEL